MKYREFHLTRGVPCDAYPCVYLPPKKFKRIEDIAPKEFRSAQIGLSTPHFLFKMRSWQAPIVITKDPLLAKYTSLKHLAQIRKLLEVIYASS